MHDEVSETENIRKNLAIERMIIEGCEILLDTSQTFVRQGTGSPGPGKHASLGTPGWFGRCICWGDCGVPRLLEERDSSVST